MKDSIVTLKNTTVNVFYFIAVLWGIYLIDVFIPVDFTQFGIVPRTIKGLVGIIFSPLIHANLLHLSSNTIPIFVLLVVLYTFYKKEATTVIITSVLITGFLVWVFGRSASHVGISGLIYSLAAFLIVAGFLRKDFKSVLVSVFVVVLYGGLIWGIFPGKFWVSWEGHLFGAVAGILMAFYLFKRNKNRD